MTLRCSVIFGDSFRGKNVSYQARNSVFFSNGVRDLFQLTLITSKTGHKSSFYRLFVPLILQILLIFPQWSRGDSNY